MQENRSSWGSNLGFLLAAIGSAVGLLFRNATNPLTLRKRYKDLMKIFHPDNIAGDHDMVLIINRIYEELKRDYEMGKRA